MWNEKLKLLSRVFVRLKAVETGGGAMLYVEKSLALILPLVMDTLMWVSTHVQDSCARTRSVILEPYRVDIWGRLPNFSALLAGVSLHRKAIGRILETASNSNVGSFFGCFCVCF